MLLVTLVAAATIKDSNSAAEDVVIFLMTSASCELTHSDRPEDWSGKIKLNQRLKKDSILANFTHHYVNVHIRKQNNKDFSKLIIIYQGNETLILDCT